MTRLLTHRRIVLTPACIRCRQVLILHRKRGDILSAETDNSNNSKYFITMRKIILATLAAIATLGGSISAQEPATTQKPVAAQEQPQAQAAPAQESIEIEITALPQPVRDAIAAKGGLEARKAFETNIEGTKYYLVILANTDGNTVEVLYNAAGEEQPK